MLCFRPPPRRPIGLAALLGSAVGWPAHFSPDPVRPAGFGRGAGVSSI